MTSTEPDWLAEILKNFRNNVIIAQSMIEQPLPRVRKIQNAAMNEAHAAITARLLEVIGKDQPEYHDTNCLFYKTDDCFCPAQPAFECNQLRKELRLAVLVTSNKGGKHERR